MKKFKQLCFPWSAKKENKYAGLTPQGIADLDNLNNNGVSIPGGLAGIRERMAAMGHFTNNDDLPPKPEGEGQGPGAEGPETAGAPSAVPQGSADPQVPKPVRRKKPAAAAAAAAAGLAGAAAAGAAAGTASYQPGQVNGGTAAAGAAGQAAAAPQEPKGMDFVITADVCTENEANGPMFSKNDSQRNKPPTNQVTGATPQPAAANPRTKAKRAESQPNDLGSSGAPIALGNSSVPIALGNSTEPIALGNTSAPIPPENGSGPIALSNGENRAHQENIQMQPEGAKSASRRMSQGEEGTQVTRHGSADLDEVAGAVFPGRDEVKLTARQLLISREVSRDQSPEARPIENEEQPAPGSQASVNQPLPALLQQQSRPQQHRVPARRELQPLAQPQVQPQQREAMQNPPSTVGDDLSKRESVSSSTPKSNFQNAISLFKNQERGVQKEAAPPPFFAKRNNPTSQDTVISRVASQEAQQQVDLSPRKTGESKNAQEPLPKAEMQRSSTVEKPVLAAESLPEKAAEQPRKELNLSALPQQPGETAMIIDDQQDALHPPRPDVTVDAAAATTDTDIAVKAAEHSYSAGAQPKPVSTVEEHSSPASTPPSMSHTINAHPDQWPPTAAPAASALHVPSPPALGPPGQPAAAAHAPTVAKHSAQTGVLQDGANTQHPKAADQGVALPLSANRAPAVPVNMEPMVVDSYGRRPMNTQIQTPALGGAVYDHHDQRNQVGKREKEGQSPGSVSDSNTLKRLKSQLQGQDRGKDIMLDSVMDFRRANPRGTFHDWLVQLTPEDITKAIMSSDKGTGIWRELWDSVQPEDLQDRAAPRAVPAARSSPFAAPYAFHAGPALLQSGSYSPYVSHPMDGPPGYMAHNLPPMQAAGYAQRDVQI